MKDDRRRTATTPQSGSELECRAFDDERAWSAWLRKHHAASRGLWLVISKKGAREKTLSYPQALEIALAWGWIDGQKKANDASTWLQRFTPRSTRSPWSKLNRERAEALIESGKMRAPGLAEVERAKRDGRWSRAYDSARSAKVPPDLARALAADRRAGQAFAKLDAANRYAILYRVQTAKKPETRARRIADFTAMLARGETIHPTRRR